MAIDTDYGLTPAPPATANPYGLEPAMNVSQGASLPLMDARYGLTATMQPQHDPNARFFTPGGGQAELRAYQPSVWDRIRNAVTAGIPNYSSRTVYNPKYGQTQLLSPEEAMTPEQRRATTLAYNALKPSEQSLETEEQVDLLISRGYWTVGNLQAVYDALSREGLLQVPRGTPRNLSAAERLKVSRMAQAGKVDQAIGFYISCALPDDEPSLELLNDPDYRSLCDAAVWAVWEDITHDYVSTPSREAFMRRHCGNRPVTLPLLNAAWSACQRAEASHARNELLGQVQRPQQPEAPSAKQIDALSDDAIDRLYHDSLRARAGSCEWAALTSSSVRTG